MILQRRWSGAAAEHLFSGADTTIHVSPHATSHLLIGWDCLCVKNGSDTHISLNSKTTSIRKNE